MSDAESLDSEGKLIVLWPGVKEILAVCDGSSVCIAARAARSEAFDFRSITSRKAS